MDDSFLSIGEVAKMLGVHLNTLRGWDKNGTLPATRFGTRRVRRYPKEQIQAFIQAGTKTKE